MQELLRLGLPAEHDVGSHPGLILLFALFCLDALDWASRPMSPKAHGEIGARRAEAEAVELAREDLGQGSNFESFLPVRLRLPH